MNEFLASIPVISPLFRYFHSLTWLFQLLWIFWAVLLFGLLFVTTAHADTRTYKPPPEVGEIYVVIDKTLVKKIIEVSIKWGDYKDSKEINLAGHDGCICVWQHMQPDSWPLEIRTNGKIINGPEQGVPLSKSGYMRFDF
ncbi:MAG: hypothetical protein LGR52_12120 [Candidatus Thiosymbion ectosymbiont of Robbea hypermnestra]|nr:hypothetical protein [Candidatus Thiosymbion ectosymbiont of Robbea hypermnestra]